MAEEKLIQAVKKGDQRAFKTLFDRYSPVLMGMAMRYARNEPDAEDILQEAFVRIHEKIGDYEGKGSFEGWMKRILMHTAINFIKKRNKEQERKNDDMEVERLEIKDDELPDDLGQEELMKAMNRLPDGYRTVFNLVVFEGYEHQEVADLLGINVGTSQSQLFKAKKMLRQQLVREDIKVTR
ncbi:MAG: RNA polymerase sigma factor [Flavobacteriales bacterium]